MECPTPSYILTSHPGDRAFKLASTSKGLTLRVPTITETSLVLRILENKENSKFDKSISDADIQELESIAHRWTTVSHPLTHLNFLIWREGKPIGITGLGWIGPCDKTQPNGPRAGAAGIVLQPFARGKGFAYKALRMVFEYGLRELGLVEIRIGSHSGNLPMRRVMEKKFGLISAMSAEVVDDFGNDLMWVVREKDLQSF
jgi:RimJ/RimL family protein N-acetyltransferase